MGGHSPCASCKLLRRRCAKDCPFAPYFPADDPHKFAIVHKVFGASNIAKMLQDLPVDQRGDAVSSLVYEANARIRDPVYGCVGAISYLQNQVAQLQMQLARAQAEILCIQMTMQSDSNHLRLPLPDSPDVPTTPLPQLLNDDDICFLLENNLPHHYLNFTSSSSTSTVTTTIQESLNKESLFGHDYIFS
ncbi:OLC1v1026886C1 [Oldenlandia corymbosa var. corymbosa]|uniref:OLC1v1026886C1 n=1 Tax=Oldenlandia corymbosa var. corymbosa TaxID=529605 RepID=A0AAV1C8J7_OLDCO|nr:OLC1v1026886C1 [Oldenlandia corymbosa var. corymbosa]